jgi:SAM-dependent methyltransferase
MGFSPDSSRLSSDMEYWEKRWKDGDTGWDIGSASTPLKAYIDQLKDKSLRILIPGCGNGYEAEYLWQQGFLNTFVVDISETALNNFHKRVPSFPKDHLLCADFFSLTGSYDLILEQTFFCALVPTLRKTYVAQMNNLLVPGGKLVGLLFDDLLNTDKPPYGGTETEYRSLFESRFNFLTFDKAYNSIPPRAGRELFLIFKKK